jgi:hypothetical protein
MGGVVHAERLALLLGGLACMRACPQAEAAAAAAEAERGERAAAQGASAQLREEGGRRARAFGDAVRSAVSRVQAELEAERDALEARCARSVPVLALPHAAPCRSPPAVCGWRADSSARPAAWCFLLSLCCRSLIHGLARRGRL